MDVVAICTPFQLFKKSLNRHLRAASGEDKQFIFLANVVDYVLCYGIVIQVSGDLFRRVIS
jgi:hypothetical protein